MKLAVYVGVAALFLVVMLSVNLCEPNTIGEDRPGEVPGGSSGHVR